MTKLNKLAKEVAKIQKELLLYRVHSVLKTLASKKNKSKREKDLEIKIANLYARIEFLGTIVELEDTLDELENIL